MSLLSARQNFTSNLLQLWEVDYAESHTDTCDLIEEYWKNARVSGFEFTADPVFTPRTTYLAMAVLSIPGGTPASAAAAIEAALGSMCAASIFTVIPPATVTPPPGPVPGGLATPGALATKLTGIFTTGAIGGSTAALVANEIANYLLGWQVTAVVPPAASAPVPIL